MRDHSLIALRAGVALCSLASSLAWAFLAQNPPFPSATPAALALQSNPSSASIGLWP